MYDYLRLNKTKMKNKKRKCHKCNTIVKYDKVSPDYFCYCPTCDEDLYKFETKLLTK